jgi:hypothetical protein
MRHPDEWCQIVASLQPAPGWFAAMRDTEAVVTTSHGVLRASSLQPASSWPCLPWGVRLTLPGHRNIDIVVVRRWLVGAALLMALTMVTAYSISPPDTNPASPGFGMSTVLSAEPWVRFGKRLVAGLGLMGFVQITRHEGGPRHWGHALILYLALLWLSRTAWPRRRYALALVLLFVTIAFQVQTFSAAVIRDRTDQFSGAPELAAYVESHDLQGLPLVAGPEAFVISAAGHLGRTFESVETEEINETMMFHDRRRAFDPAALVARAVAIGAGKHTPVLLLSNQPLPPPTSAAVQSLLLFENSQPSPHDESFKLYRVWSESWRRPESPARLRLAGTQPTVNAPAHPIGVSDAGACNGSYL